jgi:hypothetical protein
MEKKKRRKTWGPNDADIIWPLVTSVHCHHYGFGIVVLFGPVCCARGRGGEAEALSRVVVVVVD